jgi:hypothetical protein
VEDIVLQRVSNSPLVKKTNKKHVVSVPCHQVLSFLHRPQVTGIMSSPAGPWLMKPLHLHLGLSPCQGCPKEQFSDGNSTSRGQQKATLECGLGVGLEEAEGGVASSPEQNL